MARNSLEGLNILLVEEEGLIAMEVEQLCYEHGASQVFTVSSRKGLSPAILESATFDAAILDARMGEGWTAEFARHLLRRGVPFIFATSYAGWEPFFAEFPDIPVVGKPFVGTELTRTLAAVIAQTCSGDG